MAFGRTSSRLALACTLSTVGLAAITSAVPAHATVGLQLIWSRQLPGVTFRESSPVPASLSTPAFVVGGLDGKVYAFDAASGANVPGWPVATSNPINSSPAAADVVGDGHSRIFVGSGTAATTVAGACSGGGTYAFEPSGSVRWHNIGSDQVCANQAFHSSFAIGDVTGDGQPDATVGALGQTAPSYNAISGAMNPGWPFFTNDTVFSSPALADVQGKGVPDVIMGGDSTPGAGNVRGGMMRAIDGAGHLVWVFPVDEQVRSSPAVGNINGAGLSVVFGTGNFWLQNGGSNDSTALFSLDAAGHLQWRKDLGGVSLGGPALADVAGNGQPDVVEGTDGTRTNPNVGSIWVLDGNGNPLPGWGGRASTGGAIIGSISTADLNGDGAQDLLVPTGAGIVLYDGRTAQQLGTIDLGQVSFQNTPVVTDDGGAVGITVAGTRPDGTGVVEHYRVAGGQLGSVGWPMFRHDPHHTGNLGTVAACTAQPAANAPTGRVIRLAGANRDETGVKVSQAAFAQPGSATTAVIASNAGYADALAGGPLAAARKGPLLITSPSGLDPIVNAEIRRVVPTGSTVYVLGGSAALSPAVDSALTAEGYVVTRVQGSDRFQTAVAIADQLHDPSTVLEVTGLNFADALAAGPPAAAAQGVILLTNGPAQAAATGAYVAAHPGAHTAIGGPAATADPGAASIVGTDRYGTALAVATKLFTAPTAIGFATGTGFADALTGGPTLASAPGPLLLVPPCGSVPTAITDYLAGIKAGLHRAVLFGGAFAVGDDVLARLDAALA